MCCNRIIMASYYNVPTYYTQLLIYVSGLADVHNYYHTV